MEAPSARHDDAVIVVAALPLRSSDVNAVVRSRWILKYLKAFRTGSAVIVIITIRVRRSSQPSQHHTTTIHSVFIDYHTFHSTATKAQ
jgi:hypothetical protein